MKNFQNLDALDYLRILRRRLWYFVLPALIVTIAAIVYASRLPFEYRSETTIQIASRIVPEDYIGSLLHDNPSDRLEFVRQQIRSRTFIERIIQEFQLTDGTRPLDSVVSAVIKNTDITTTSSTAFKLGYQATDPNLAQAITKRLAERVMQLNDTFRKEKVSIADQFLDEQLRLASKDLAEAETALREFNTKHFAGIPEQGVDANGLTTLQSQLSTIETDLAAAMQSRTSMRQRLEEQLQLKQVANVSAPPVENREAVRPTETAPVQASPLEQQLQTKQTELGANLSRYTALHPDVQRLSREVQELEVQVARARGAEVKPTKQEQPVAGSSAPLQSAVLPVVASSVEVAEAELQFEISRLDRDIAAKQRAKADVSAKIGQYLSRLNMKPEVAEEMAALERDVKSAKDRYSLMSTRKVSSELAGRVDTNENNATFKVVDPASLPQTPIGLNHFTVASFGTLGGVLAGIMLAFGREFLDPGLRDEHEATNELKLFVMGSIPVVAEPKPPAKASRRRKERRLTIVSETTRSDLAAAGRDTEISNSSDIPLRLLNHKVRAVVSEHGSLGGEQYQLLRTRLVQMRKERGEFKTILISSSVPNEGKTFVASCIAGILAREPDKRVLLVDADLRTSSASRLWGISDERQSYGLNGLLKSKVDCQSSILQCSEMGLHILPAGKCVEDPAHLLNAPSLEGTFRDLEREFDWIIVDSPPILGLADANILLPLCDAALLVVRAEKTPVSLIRDSIQRIGEPALCGIVMNRVTNLAWTNYYKGYYQHSQSK